MNGFWLKKRKNIDVELVKRWKCWKLKIENGCNLLQVNEIVMLLVVSTMGCSMERLGRRLMVHITLNGRTIISATWTIRCIRSYITKTTSLTPTPTDGRVSRTENYNPNRDSPINFNAKILLQNLTRNPVKNPMKSPSSIYILAFSFMVDLFLETENGNFFWFFFSFLLFAEWQSKMRRSKHCWAHNGDKNGKARGCKIKY